MARETKVSDIISRVREVTNDTVATTRIDDTTIIRWLNDALKTMVSVVPSVFYKQAQYTCVAGVRQTPTVARLTTIVDILGVPECDMSVLALFRPGWQEDEAGDIKNWMRLPNDPLTFFVYPAAPTGNTQKIYLQYVQVPATLTTTAAVVDVPENYLPAIVDYCVSMLDAKDDEHVNSGRSSGFMDRFINRIKGA